MNRAQIYRRAAEVMFYHTRGEDCACGAIWFAQDDWSDKSNNAAVFGKVFGTVSNSVYWGKEWGENADECRVLALLFAAAMAEHGDI